MKGKEIWREGNYAWRQTDFTAMLTHKDDAIYYVDFSGKKLHTVQPLDKRPPLFFVPFLVHLCNELKIDASCIKFFDGTVGNYTVQYDKIEMQYVDDRYVMRSKDKKYLFIILVFPLAETMNAYWKLCGGDGNVEALFQGVDEDLNGGRCLGQFSFVDGVINSRIVFHECIHAVCHFQRLFDEGKLDSIVKTSNREEEICEIFSCLSEGILATMEECDHV